MLDAARDVLGLGWAERERKVASLLESRVKVTQVDGREGQRCLSRPLGASGERRWGQAWTAGQGSTARTTSNRSQERRSRGQSVPAVISTWTTREATAQ